MSGSCIAAARKRTQIISVDGKRGTVHVAGLLEKRALNLGIVLAR
ncbi:unnamed protein product [Gongylonema pulchrum]|uniref:Uncharacterized protein n=1 Tax=Gongylonema pulchrum TaxID=637853 RepID=A0A3P6RKN0_9BILA|nr:unnamed protein product [Gongylonema pulchrum]